MEVIFGDNCMKLECLRVGESLKTAAYDIPGDQ
jgi:hypothetical protein